ncbi:non-ribosomal peptide synthetase [Catellatospora vulcania]|uniref:non-ribosomal peptide synthetase n=1 Tax=Catellatospora vulcania TaxID=1460450 RepID=UPI0012D47F3E|nr:amino acid adenylation domain-containing protein [Catellatospora vulcania]
MSTATPAQHGMWLTERLGLAATAYHMPLPVWLDGPLDPARLADACAAAVARHPVLSCAFTEQDGELQTAPAARTPSLRLSAAPDDLAAFVRERTLAPFDLAAGPLIRFDLVPAGPGRHLLLIVAHHLVFDGESKEILLADLAAAYSTPPPAPRDPAPGAGRTEAGPAVSGKPQQSRTEFLHLPRNWPNPAARQDGVAGGVGEEGWSGEVMVRAVEHWAGFRAPGEPSLPGLRGVSAAGARPGVAVPFDLDAVAVRAAAAELGATTFEVVLAGLLTLLDRYGDPAPTVGVDLGTRPADGHDRVGLHVNELPIGIPATGPADPVTVRERVAAVRHTLRETYPLRAVPLSRAVSGLAPRAALTPVSISYRRRARPAPVFAGLDARVEWTAFHHAARNALHVQLLDDPAAADLPVLLHVDPARLDPADAARVGAHLRTLLDGFARQPDAPLHDLDLLDPSEHELLATWNDTGRAVPGPQALHELVGAAIAARPDAVAVVAADSAMTYAQLDAEAAAVAAQLRGRGIGPGDLVAVCLPRTSRLLPALLGVLRTGAAYLPLDPEHPPARRDGLLADAGPAAVLTADADGSTVLAETTPPIPGDPAMPPTVGDPATPSRHEPGLCYVIYTSGSTGRPKGVAVEHRAVVNLLHALPDVVPTGPGDVWLAVASAAFDMSVPELWLPLVTGGTVVLATAEQARDGELLLKLLRLTGATHAHLTPSTWRRLLDAGFAERGVVAVCGAEALPAPLAAELRSQTSRLVNLYGPTETTVWSTAADLTGGGPVTIGRPLANTTAYVLDAALRPVPHGIVGELCLGGAGVARGYLGRPELTADRFVDTAWGRLYRTGDRVRRLPDGSLEFHGRIDDQLKVRGHRIEPGEVEAFLRAAESVVDAAVTVSADGDALVAYVVGAPDPARLREQLAAGLPGYLVPSVFLLVEQLPRNANGKLDRAALAGLAGAPLVPQASPRPYTGLALQVYEIWREVLGHGEIGPDDDLFDLGGHSLTVTKIAARLRRRLGVDLPLHVFFDTPTINGIVAAADR